ncbi:MAG: hypothetical protein RBJ76_03660 [Stenomitos frigidus ULC029]
MRNRQFVEDPLNQRIDSVLKILSDKLLLEPLPLAGIVRVVGVSEPWLQSCVKAEI